MKPLTEEELAKWKQQVKEGHWPIGHGLELLDLFATIDALTAKLAAAEQERDEFANRYAAAEAQVAEYREALEWIADFKCSLFDLGPDCTDEFPQDIGSWCQSCIARAALSPKERPTCRCGHPEGRHAKSQLSCADCRDCLAFRPKGETDE